MGRCILKLIFASTLMTFVVSLNASLMQQRADELSYQARAAIDPFRDPVTRQIKPEILAEWERAATQPAVTRHQDPTGVFSEMPTTQASDRTPHRR